MNKNRPYVIVSYKWLLAANKDCPYPRDTKVAITGYREEKGIGDLFSVVVEFLDAGQSGTFGATRAAIQALVEEMDSRMPVEGERLILTAGSKPVAECIVIEEVPGLGQ